MIGSRRLLRSNFLSATQSVFVLADNFSNITNGYRNLNFQKAGMLLGPFYMSCLISSFRRQIMSLGQLPSIPLVKEKSDLLPQTLSP